jgi:hypothetical protein
MGSESRILKNYYRHDYEGITNGITKNGMLSHMFQLNILNSLKNTKDLIDIQFEKVSAHTNDTFNEKLIN